jgi:hypothetical protein
MVLPSAAAHRYPAKIRARARPQPWRGARDDLAGSQSGKTGLTRLGGLGQLAKPKPLISQESSCKGLHYGAGSEAGAEAVIFGGGCSGRTSLSSPSSSLRSLSGSV